jgi:hypothetical protein
LDQKAGQRVILLSLLSWREGTPMLMTVGVGRVFNNHMTTNASRGATTLNTKPSRHSWMALLEGGTNNDE